METEHFDGLDLTGSSSKTKARLQPGEILVVPLSDYLNERGYGLAMVWGSDGWSTASLWLYGPLLRRPPSLSEAVPLIRADNSLGPKRTGARAIEQRGWRSLGVHPDFDLDTWPRPTWGSERGGGSDIGYLTWLSFPLRKKAVLEHEEVDRATALAYPPHAGHGVTAVEIGLVRQLLTGVDPYQLHGEERLAAQADHKARIEAGEEGFFIRRSE